MEEMDTSRWWRWLGSGVCLAVLVAAVVVTAQGNMAAQDEEDLSYSLNQLYKETKGGWDDPHDMLRGRNPGPGPRGGGRFGALWEEELQPQEESSGAEPCKCEGEETSQEMSGCLIELASLQMIVKEEQQKAFLLQKQLVKEGALDMQAFYKRAVLHFWNILQLENAQDLLREGNNALIKQVSVRVTQEDLEALQDYLKDEKLVHKVDEFLESAFKLMDPPPSSSRTSLQSFLHMAATAMEGVKSIEVWLYVLCAGFLVLAVWAVLLFVKDIQRELRWGRVLTMMMTVVFFICCLWHWRHMHKVAESRRHAQMIKRGYSDFIPEECKPGGKDTSYTIIGWILNNVFHSQDKCERYFEELMVDFSDEITPAMVIAETLSKFFFQPLQHLGTEMAKLTTNFYSNVPFVYHIPATVLFLVLLVTILFYMSGYGIDFPLWMGGIRPMYKPDSPNNSAEVERLRREAVEQLRQDREKFLEESRNMLADISRAAIRHQSQGQLQPLMLMSSDILETQLEGLISRHLDTVLTHHQAMAHPHSFPGGVDTVTSTPLRTSFTPQPTTGNNSTLQERIASENNIGESNSEATFGQNDEPASMLVSTDAAFYRLTATSRPSVLPPKSHTCSSTSSSAAPSVASSTASSLKERSKRFFGLKGKNKSASLDCPTPSSPSLSLASTRSGSQEESSHESDQPDSPGLEDSGVSASSESFFSQVGNIFNNSVNSSMNEDQDQAQDQYQVSTNRRLATSSNSRQGQQDQLQEVEFNASSNSFIETVKQMTQDDSL